MKTRLKQDWASYLLLSMVWCHTILLQYVRAVVLRVPFIGSYPDMVMIILYMGVIALASKRIFFSKGDLLFLSIVLAVYCISPILYPATMPFWKEECMRFFWAVIPCYIVGTNIIKKQNSVQIMRLLYILSCITIIVKMLDHFLSGNAMSELQSMYQGDMDGAYKLLPHLCMVVYYVVKKPTLWNLSIAAAGTIFLTFLGTRGAVLVEVICGILLLCLLSNWKHKGIKITALAALAGGFLFSPLFLKTIRLMEQTARKMGLSVRIFDKLLSGNLTYGSGRDELASQLYEALKQSPLFGFGLYGDRPIIGIYAHKLFLELWIDFGYLFGTLIMIALGWVIIKAYRTTKCKDEKALIVILCSAGVFKLFLSGSYLHETMLFMLLGVCASIIRNERRNDKIVCVLQKLT